MKKGGSDRRGIDSRPIAGDGQQKTGSDEGEARRLGSRQEDGELVEPRFRRPEAQTRVGRGENRGEVEGDAELVEDRGENDDDDDEDDDDDDDGY